MGERPRVALFWGEDEFLLRHTGLEFLEAEGVRATEVHASDWQGGELSDLATPSLWGERRALFVADCQALPEQGVREIRSYLGSPAPDAFLVLTLISRSKGPPPLARLVSSAGGMAKQVALSRQDVPKWVAARARHRGLDLTAPGTAALLATIGEDPATLDQAVEQLAAAFPGQPVGTDQVRAQFEGRAEQRVWDLCDRAFAGRLSEAMVTLRSLLDAREDPLLILGGIASRLRDLIRVQSLPERMSSAEAAKAAGLRFDWQVRRYRDQARRFSPEEMTALHGLVVESDRALKGGVPGDVVLPGLVAAISGEPEAQLRVPIRVSR